MACDFTEPYDHSSPVHHAALQIHLRDWPDECVWAQLQYVRWEDERTEHKYTGDFLGNLEREWQRRGVCSRCHREIDQPLDQQMTDLQARVHDAEEKLARVRRLLPTTSDPQLRAEVSKVLG
jgi:hypothetical protein